MGIYLSLLCTPGTLVGIHSSLLWSLPNTPGIPWCILPSPYYRRHVRGWDQCRLTELWAQGGRNPWVGREAGLPFS